MIKRILCDTTAAAWVIETLAGRAAECGCCLAWRMLTIGFVAGGVVGAVLRGL